MKPFTFEINKNTSRNLPYKTPLGNFKSQKEAERFETLYNMQQNGDICELNRYAVFMLIPPVYKTKRLQIRLRKKCKVVKKKVCIKQAVKFTIDIIYRDKKGRFVAEMVKPAKEYKDPSYIVKNKLMYYLHRINVREN